jgi:nucleoid DNA-binding protein
MMNKAELIHKVAEVTSTKKDAKAAVDCVVFAITEALKQGDAVTLIGFGTFKVSERKGRRGRNPRTGHEIEIKGKKVPKFRAGKALRDAVN